MKHRLVLYKVKPEAVAENRRLIRLKSDAAEGAFELGGLPAFQAYRRGIGERCEVPLVVRPNRKTKGGHRANAVIRP